MSAEHLGTIEPRMKQALAELEGMVRKRYPNASFKVEPGEDNPEGVHLITTVDVEDPDEVLDVVIDRVLHFQVDDGLPVHVIPVRPLERVKQELRSSRRLARPKLDWGAIRPPVQP